MFNKTCEKIIYMTQIFRFQFIKSKYIVNGWKNKKEADDFYNTTFTKLKINPHDYILDLAAGTGYVRYYFNTQPELYIGIDKLTLDHIHPLSKAEEGRIYTIDDIQPLCLSCNQSKGGRLCCV